MKKFTFPGGERHIVVDSPSQTIHKRITSSNDLIDLLLLTNAYRSMGVKHLNLLLPYLPYARQDRIMNYGEPLSIKMFAELINLQNYSSVSVYDPHSDVGPALINNCYTNNNHSFVQKCMSSIGYVDDPVLVSPDAGANKKMGALCRYTNHKGYIRCDKTRDTKTGKLAGFEVYHDDLEGRPCVIVDDICDGGGTFLGLAEKLKEKGAGDLYLIVSHGIFSKGLKDLSKVFKNIYTTNSFREIKGSEFEMHNERYLDCLTVIDLEWTSTPID